MTSALTLIERTTTKHHTGGGRTPTVIDHTEVYSGDKQLVVISWTGAVLRRLEREGWTKQQYVERIAARYLPKPETTLLGYVAQPRGNDGKLKSLLTGKTGKIVLFGTMSDAYRAIHGYGVVHEKTGPDTDEALDLYDSELA